MLGSWCLSFFNVAQTKKKKHDHGMIFITFNLRGTYVSKELKHPIDRYICSILYSVVFMYIITYTHIYIHTHTHPYTYTYAHTCTSHARLAQTGRNSGGRHSWQHGDRAGPSLQGAWLQMHHLHAQQPIPSTCALNRNACHML